MNERIVDVRRASSSDGELLAELGAETFLDSFGEDNRPENMAAYIAKSFSPEKQAAELVEKGSVFLIARVEDEVAGYARLREGRSPEQVRGRRSVELARLYARRQWIGRGVGAALMEACLVEARERGCDSVWLGVWSENERGIAFYRRWGFSSIGTKVFHLGDEAQTDLIMRCPI
jgi:diamine N-acetyltransferase